jgi:response regulator NasT
MNKILVCAEDSLSIIRIERLLLTKNRPYDIQKSPIKKDELLRYEVIIIHSSWRLSNVFSFIENIVLSKTIPVIYITSLINIAPFIKILDSGYFSMIDENKIDIELPLTLSLLFKFINEYNRMNLENKKIIIEYEQKRMIDHCKGILMNQGLSEEEAHRFIQKRAMDMHISKYDVCMQIIKKNNENDIE